MMKENHMTCTNNLEKLLLKDNNINNESILRKELIFKILVIGDFGVGKTAIIRRYADGTFSSSYKITIGADFAIKFIEIENHTRINLHLWDIAGHERFGYLTGVYYRHAVAAIIVFDLTRPNTFQSVEKWLLDLRKKVYLPGGQNIPLIILANKGDITIETIPEEIVCFCEKYNILAWFITSAKENINIDKAMNILINEILNNHNKLQVYQNDEEEKIDLVKLNDKPDKYIHNRNCCQT